MCITLSAGEEEKIFMTWRKLLLKLRYDQETQIAYICKVVDEIIKNHKESNAEIVTGFMPQILDPKAGLPHKICLVRSF